MIHAIINAVRQAKIVTIYLHLETAKRERLQIEALYFTESAVVNAKASFFTVR